MLLWMLWIIFVQTVCGPAYCLRSLLPSVNIIPIGFALHVATVIFNSQSVTTNSIATLSLLAVCTGLSFILVCFYVYMHACFFPMYVLLFVLFSYRTACQFLCFYPLLHFRMLGLRAFQ